jgi:hypothetical protein
MLLYGMWTAYDLAKLQQEYDAAIAGLPGIANASPGELASLYSTLAIRMVTCPDDPPHEPDYFAIASALASH